MIYHITEAEDGRILRSFLKETLQLSTRTVTALKRKADGILLNDHPVTVRAVLKAGDRLSLATEDDESNADLVPRAIPVDMLYEDEWIAVCFKPADMPTHPSHGHFEDTLANALAHRYRDRPFIFRAITRLDRETSGAVLVAKDAVSAHALSRAMQEGEIQKCYFALVHGETPAAGEIALPIRRTKNSVILRETHPDGAPAKTLYRRIHTDGTHSLLAVFPLTGRTHQIRLHMASVGHPILGDSLYGRASDGLSRTMLHAARLSFSHPAKRERLTVFAPPACDLRDLLLAHGFPLPTLSDTLPEDAGADAGINHHGELGQ